MNKKLLVVIFLIYGCCPVKNIYIESINSGTNKNCETCSYKIIQPGKQIGYVIGDCDYNNPGFLFNKETSMKLIDLFEKKMAKKYGSYYDDYYRQYGFFIGDNVYAGTKGDTILMINFLNQKEIISLGKWCCVRQEVGTHYFRKYHRKHPSSFYYNLTKGSFDDY